MKDAVDFENLDDAVNTAMTRYSYFTIHVELNQDGDYVLLITMREL